MRRSVVSLLVSWFVFASLSATAQSNHLSGFVTGKVFAGEATLPGATIEVTSDGMEWIAVSDNKGRFFVPHLPPGDYTIRAAFEGVETEKEQVRLERGRFATRDLAMTVDPSRGKYEPPAAAPQGRAERVELADYLRAVMLDPNHGWGMGDTEALMRGFDFSEPAREPSGASR